MPNKHFEKVFYILIAFICSCSSSKNTGHTTADLTHLNYTIQEAPEWTALFKRTSGWYGGDGIFAIPSNGKENSPVSDTSKNIILFSDSMIGDTLDSKPSTISNMIHNSVAIIQGKEPKNEKIRFYWDVDKQGGPKTIFIPNTPSTQAGDYYWLGDGFVNTAKNNSLYIFAYKMRTLDPNDDWSFINTKTNLIVIPAGSKPPFTDQRQIETPLAFLTRQPDSSGTFGAGILVNTKEAAVNNGDGYVYVYGIRGKAKNLIVARVKPQQIEDFSEWKFWNGKVWDNNLQNVTNIVDGVSDELSVTPLEDGRYLLVFQSGGMSNTVAMRIGASPVGPFGPAIKLYNCPEAGENRNYIMYNAKAHPSLSNAGELLISYNVNSFHFLDEIRKNPTLYRPRFIKLKFQ